MRVLMFTLLFFYVLVIPVGICALRDRYPNWFHRTRILLWLAGLSAFSWGCTLGAILIPCYLGLYVPRGPELVFALFCGWAYLWIAGFPVFATYGILRLFCRPSCRRIE